jgi:2-deoxy-D-gluconate 3-dehydrogenase
MEVIVAYGGAGLRPSGPRCAHHRIAVYHLPMTSPFSLDGHVAVVTGANTGIGQGIAVALASAGADVALVGRSSAGETADRIRAIGRRTTSIAADLATTAPVRTIVDETVRALGGLDILVNNAGIIRRADALDFTEADWDAVMDTNLKAAFFLCQAAGRIMVERFQRDGRRGKIINVASMLSFQGGVRVPSYTASKSGLAGVTRLLANEWAGRGINVNALAPGYIATNNTAVLQADATRNRQILERIPAGRWGTPDDLAGAAVFLASPASDYVHGHVLAVDGGWLAR